MSPPEAAEPVFAEPWQAQAFALAVHLQAAGAFTAAEWTEALAAEIATAADLDGSAYYERWLSALERIALERGFADRRSLDERSAAWAEAYARTPHGQPVELLR